MSKKPAVRLGIIGVGNMGSAHARNVLDGQVPGMTLAALCDTNPEKLSGFPEVAGFSHASELIGSGTVDAVIVATPHYDHTTIGIEALKAGLHVLVEKPISVHKADCEKLIAAYGGGDQVFAAMFNQRTNPVYRKLKQLIDGGELGAIRRVNWIITDWYRTEQYYASGGWRATWKGEGGGVLLNQCPHQLDLMQWLFGMPKKVRAFCGIGQFHNVEVEDNVTAFLEYENGATGVFITTTGEAPGTNRLEVAADNGKVVIEGPELRYTRNEQLVSRHLKECETGFDKPSVWQVTIDPGKAADASEHVRVMKNFVAVIQDGAPLLAPAVEGIHSVELANAMLYSHFTETTVALPLDAGAYEEMLKGKIAGSKFVKKTVESNAPAAGFSQSF